MVRSHGVVGVHHPSAVYTCTNQNPFTEGHCYTQHCRSGVVRPAFVSEWLNHLITNVHCPSNDAGCRLNHGNVSKRR